MSFIAAALIGGGAMVGSAALSGSGGGSMSQASTLTPGQKDLLEKLTSLLGGQVGQGVTPYQGLRPGEVPFGPLQQQALGLAGGMGQNIGVLGGGFQQGMGLFNQALSGYDPSQGQGFLGQAGQALQQGLGFDPTQSILQALEPGRQLALNTFNQDIIPDLMERFGATSGQSGGLNRALSEAGANLSLGLGAQAAPWLGQAALMQPGLQMQGAGMAGNLAQMPSMLAGQGAQLGGMGIGMLGQQSDLLSQLMNMGGLQQQQQAGVAGAEQARWQEAQGWANPWLSQYGPLALGTSAVENVYQQPSPGLFSSVMPALGQMGGGFLGSETGSNWFANLLSPSSGQMWPTVGF